MSKRNRDAVEATEVFETEGTETQATETPAGEFEAGVEATSTETAAPTAEEAAAEAKDTRKWHLADGTEVTKSEFIRDQFTNHNLSRKQISEQFDINYRTVYGATVNMVNEAEPATRGRSASSAKILVTASGHVITEVEGVKHVDNVAVADDNEVLAEETSEVDRNTWITDQVAAGRDRSDVAKALGLSYGVVYSMTKEVAGNKQRHEVEYNGETMSRSEYIRRRNAEGVSRADIAKELGVDYPVVWSALKGLKSDEDKFADAVERLAKFEEQAVDAEAFKALIEQLKAVTLKQPEPEATETPATEAPVASEEVAATEV